MAKLQETNAVNVEHVKIADFNKTSKEYFSVLVLVQQVSRNIFNGQI